jgi:hypothetical protein
MTRSRPADAWPERVRPASAGSGPDADDWQGRLRLAAEESLRRRRARAAERRERAGRRARGLAERHAWRLARLDARAACAELNRGAAARDRPAAGVAAEPDPSADQVGGKAEAAPGDEGCGAGEKGG